jgi:hypothetical protein
MVAFSGNRAKAVFLLAIGRQQKFLQPLATSRSVIKQVSGFDAKMKFAYFAWHP